MGGMPTPKKSASLLVRVDSGRVNHMINIPALLLQNRPAHDNRNLAQILKSGNPNIHQMHITEKPFPLNLKNPDILIPNRNHTKSTSKRNIPLKE
jgi:hypothetical protein